MEETALHVSDIGIEELFDRRRIFDHLGSSFQLKHLFDHQYFLCQGERDQLQKIPSFDEDDYRDSRNHGIVKPDYLHRAKGSLEQQRNTNQQTFRRDNSGILETRRFSAPGDVRFVFDKKKYPELQVSCIIFHVEI